MVARGSGATATAARRRRGLPRRLLGAGWVLLLVALSAALCSSSSAEGLRAAERLPAAALVSTL